MWDLEGKQYFDFLAAYSAVNQGHCHPRSVFYSIIHMRFHATHYFIIYLFVFSLYFPFLLFNILYHALKFLHPSELLRPSKIKSIL